MEHSRVMDDAKLRTAKKYLTLQFWCQITQKKITNNK
jgi:hypothetical protein